MLQVGEVAPGKELKAQASKLTEGHQYVFRAVAENSVGISDPCETQPITAKLPFGESSPVQSPSLQPDGSNCCHHHCQSGVNTLIENSEPWLSVLLVPSEQKASGFRESHCCWLVQCKNASTLVTYWVDELPQFSWKFFRTISTPS